MLIFAGDSGVPDDADYRLVVDGCEWALTRAEFESLQDTLEPIDEAECDEIEDELQTLREDQ